MANFSSRLRELRNSKGLTQQELARYVNISKSSINMYERGEREPSLAMLETIADFFNVDLDYLLGKSDIPNQYLIHSNMGIIPPDISVAAGMVPAKARIALKHSKEIEEMVKTASIPDIIVFTMYLQLDEVDKAKIHSEVQQMLKSDKYN